MGDATSLAAAIAEGRVTASGAMAAALLAAETRADLGAVSRVEANLGRAAAAAADEMPTHRRGPFHGVPFLAKDLGSQARGLGNRAGSAALGARVTDPTEDDDLFARFRASGLVPFGLTTVPDLGLALSSEPVGGAPARNPFDPSRTPGGSSGGAAAAVASGIVAIAHATDAAGSIRVPAACCGLFGLKPTRGQIPQGPGFGNHLLGIASELVLARSLRDVRRAFEAVSGMARGPEPDARPVPPSDPPRIGFAIPTRCGGAAERAVRDVARALRESGCDVAEGPAPDDLGAACASVAGTVFRVSVAAFLDDVAIPDADMPPIIAATAREGRNLPATALFAAAGEIARLSHAGAHLFDGIDAVLCPVLAGAPSKLGHFDPANTDPGHRFAEMEAMAPNVAIANVAGLPALAFPAGMEGGLPVGVQLMGPMGADLALLEVAARLDGRVDPIAFPHPVAGLPA